jgi:hypothetical protein
LIRFPKQSTNQGALTIIDASASYKSKQILPLLGVNEIRNSGWEIPIACRLGIRA